MFLQEKELKEMFWKSYNRSKRAIRYQFECAIRDGNADLVTIEQFQGKYQINDANDLLYKEGNLPYVNKSWIVIPIEKKNLILDKYKNYLDEKKYIGVIGVEPEGRYSIIYQPRFQLKVLSHQEIIKVCVIGL